MDVHVFETLRDLVDLYAGSQLALDCPVICVGGLLRLNVAHLGIFLVLVDVSVGVRCTRVVLEHGKEGFARKGTRLERQYELACRVLQGGLSLAV